MKKRAKHSIELLDKLSNDYSDIFRDLNNICKHFETYENIITKCVNKRDALRFALEHPDGVFSGMSMAKYHDMLIQYTLLVDLLKGVE